MIDKNEKKDNKGSALEINIVPLLLHLVKRLWLILLIGLACGALTFTVTKLFVHPTYRCGFTAYINNKHATINKETLSSSDVNAAKELVLTYSKIIKSNTILSEAIKENNLDYSVKQLKGMVGTEIQDQTEIIQVYVVAPSPEDAYEVAVAISTVSPKEMANIVEGSSMKIVEYPQVPDSIYSPSYFRYSLLGAGIGMLITIIILIVRYLSNDTITDEGEVENRFAVPVLGVIPDNNAGHSGKYGYYDYYYQDNHKGGHKSEKA